MALCDFHLHTNFSYDSTADIDDVITTAIKHNMPYMAITDHHDFDLDGGVFEQKDILTYFNTLCLLKDKYADKIKLSRGLELGLDTKISKRLYDFTSSCPFDFIIGSVHGVDGLDPYYDNYWEGLSVHQGMEKYFNTIYESICAYDNFDVLGHIDYAIRYAKTNNEKIYSYSEYADILDKILKKVIEMDKGIEVNTGGLRKGLTTTNPSEEIIKKYKEYGGKIITVGSDAHTLEDIAADFDTAKDILLRCGFTEYCVFINRKPIFLPLS